MLIAAFLLLSQIELGTPPSVERDLRTLATPLIEGEVVHGLVVGWIEADGSFGSFGLGRLSREHVRRPNRETVFEIGSITKVFTGLLLARSVVDGELSLDSELRDLLPEDSRPPRSLHPIRLVDLATHSAGFPEVPPNLKHDVKRLFADYSVFGDSHMRAFLAGFEPQTIPGETYRYSNAGFGVLGWALAHRAGSDFEMLIQSQICDPLRLTSTAITITPELRKRLAPTHDSNGDPVPPSDFGALVACGGLRSSVSDLLLFLEAQLNPRDELRSALTLAAAHHFESPSGTEVGLAWHIVPGGNTRFHDGLTSGHAAFVCFDPSKGTAGVLLANGSSVRVAELGHQIQRRLSGLEFAPPNIRIPVAVEPRRLSELTGRYSSATGRVMTVTLVSGRLYAQLFGQPAFRILAYSPTHFFYRDIEAELSFGGESTNSGTDSVVLHQNGRDDLYKRTL